MEAKGNPIPLPDSPEAILKTRPWLSRFRLWQSLIKKGCSAATGQGGVMCSWVGSPCCYNICPRRNFEEAEFTVESLQKIEALEKTIQKLRQANKEQLKQINQLKKKLG